MEYLHYYIIFCDCLQKKKELPVLTLSIVSLSWAMGFQKHKEWLYFWLLKRRLLYFCMFNVEGCSKEIKDVLQMAFIRLNICYVLWIMDKVSLKFWFDVKEKQIGIFAKVCVTIEQKKCLQKLMYCKRVIISKA